ncbi:ATP-binding protein [Marinobacterium litorale]|uniref:ATP-binding protein n=1 Tax=Marinobacterium litorale TaxID=404770 RepID=UPI0003F67FD3|nr:SbcC/MukB-like Walker B domain-containing protein [Marinobacterium litorale]
MTQAAFWHQEATYRLQELKLFNWGGFSGAHHAQIHLDGTAVIGPTGSGKTTLVDALMTLLCANPKYNLASTGGHESDRDLVSYVRGVSGPGDESAQQSHIARPGKTVTGIAATLDNGENLVRLGVLLWFDNTSSATTDLKRLWFFATSPDQTLEHWLTTHHEGGMRALRQLEKNHTGIWTYSAKKDFLARVRDFFEVRENAFNLLNRAAGLKQLNSIDEIFRELVLDDTSAFDRAREVADSFDDLSAIHEELEIARRQQRSLEPVKNGWQKYQSNEQLLSEKARLNRILPVWFGEQAYQLWSDECDRLTEAFERAQENRADADRRYDVQEGVRNDLKEAYLNLGGSDIQTLESLIAEKRKNLGTCEKYAAQYRQLAQKLALPDEVDRQVFNANKEALAERFDEVRKEAEDAAELAFEHGVAAKQARDSRDTLKEELKEVERRPGSNIPATFHHFRAALAEELGLDEDRLPFVAELVQVKEAEQAWRGAIERAIGAHRLRILVPPESIQAALRWVNQRHNRLHVRLLEVKAPGVQPRFLDDGFTRKLEYKTHPYRESVKAMLAGYDRHCVDSPEQLRDTPNAMTQQGLMSGKARFFDKQDQRRLDEDWQTGFDNRDRLAALARKIADADRECETLKAQVEKSKAAAQQLQLQLTLLDQLQNLTFEQIDVDEARRQVTEQEDKLKRLTAPDSDVSAAKETWQQAEKVLKEIAEEREALHTRYINLERDLIQAKAHKSKAFQRAQAGLTVEQRQLADAAFPAVSAEQLKDISDIERNVLEQLQKELESLRERVSDLARELTKLMAAAKREDRGALSDVGMELEDVPQYLERLQLLTEEALPEKQKQFKAYLNRSSDEGVTQLLSHVDNEVAMIEERLEDVNNTLRRTDFQSGRYLQLVSSKVIHESLRSLQHAQRKLASARFNDDEGESQYWALQNIVEQLRDACDRHRTLGAKALLDPRFRLEFKVSVIDRESGKIIETRRGSQGGSGGEKEIIASYVLTASLSYALCPDGSSRPLFGTIVLDEAFSRSSHAVAGRIIAALKEFGLHALFITPNKEMRLLRNHTRSAIVVHRRGLESNLTTLSWQALDDLYHQHTAASHEVPQ